MDDFEDCLLQVYRMARASLQSYTLWIHTAVDGPHEEILRQFPHFFEATNEAHLTMMFISLDALYAPKDKYQSFAKLLPLLEPKIESSDFTRIKEKVEKLTAKSRGVGILRNNAFAHIVEREKRLELGEKHGLNHGEFISLCYNTLDIATQISHLLGGDVPSAEYVQNETLEDFLKILARLAPNPEA